MGTFSRLSDQDVEKILAGQAPGGDPLDAHLAAFTREVRATFAAPLPPEIQGTHLAAAVAAAQGAPATGDPAIRPAGNKARAWASGSATWQRRTVLGGMFASLSAKIALGAVAAMAATGALAAAGALPAPAQQAVSTAASSVGINLPAAHHHNPKASDGEEGTPTGTVTASVQPIEDSPTATASPAPNHGSCVSFATSEAGSLGFSGSQRGEFVARIAKDRGAISAKVSSDGHPDPACQAAIDLYEAAVKASPGPGDATSGSRKDNGTGGQPTSPTPAASSKDGSHPQPTPSAPSTGAGSVSPTPHPTGRP